jgi:hypothetical protein
MKKLFTNDLIFEKGFLSPEVCKKWQGIIFKNPKIFGPDVKPEYGQMAAFYGMLEAGLNESYFRYAEQHNKFLLKHFPEIKKVIAFAGEKILTHSGLKANALPIVPRDKKYFLIAGFNLQLSSWRLYNIHTDTEGLVQYPDSIFNPDTRAYSCVISIKRTAQHGEDRGGDLDIWRERYLAHELDQFYKADGVHARSKRKRVKIEYGEGNLILFDSFMPHVVLPFKVEKKKDRRVSLVVHFNYRKWTERNPFPHLEYWY